jgi:hypothetical protein
VAALGGERIVHVGGDHAIDPQLLGYIAELGYVVAALGKVEGRHQSEHRALRRAGVGGHTVYTRLLRQNEIHLGARAVHLDASHGLNEIVRQISLVN